MWKIKNGTTMKQSRLTLQVNWVTMTLRRCRNSIITSILSRNKGNRYRRYFNEIKNNRLKNINRNSWVSLRIECLRRYLWERNNNFRILITLRKKTLSIAPEIIKIIYEMIKYKINSSVSSYLFWAPMAFWLPHTPKTQSMKQRQIT